MITLLHCYLIPLFKEVLDFHTCCGEAHDTVSDLISGRTYGNTNTGFAAVCNTGNDRNWTGNDLAAANFYGFGRLAFCHTLSAEEIAEEWIRMSLSNDAEVVEKVKGILLGSRRTYEKYTCPLGIGWMVTPDTHYGCSVDGYEYSRWGTYHGRIIWGWGWTEAPAGRGMRSNIMSPTPPCMMIRRPVRKNCCYFFHHVPYPADRQLPESYLGPEESPCFRKK